MAAPVAIFLIDLLLIFALWPMSVWLVLERPVALESWTTAAIFAVINLICLYALGLYRRENVTDLAKSIRRIPMTLVIVIASVVSATTILGWPLPPSLIIAAAICFSSCIILARLILLRLRRHSLFRTRLLIIGAGERAWDLVWLLRSQGRYLQYDVTFVHEDSFGRIDPRLSGDPSNRIIMASSNLLQVVESIKADQIVVAPDDRRGMVLETLITCRAAGYPVFQYMTFLEKEAYRIDIKRLELAWMLYSEGFNAGLVDRVLKRLFDVIESLSSIARSE